MIRTATRLRRRPASEGANATGLAAPLAAALLAGLVACAPHGPERPAPGGPPGGHDGWIRDVVPFEVLDENGVPYAHPFLGGLSVPRPQFVDIDGDGDLDLFVQERSGEVMFFENVGTATDPEFVWRTDRFQDLDVGEWNRFVDLTGDGRLELIAEERYSYIRYFRNEGTPTDPRFVLAADSLRDVEGRPIFSDRQNIPNVEDVDCDGRPDLFLGRIEGTVTRYAMAGVDDDGVPVFEFVTDRFEGIEIVNTFGSMHGANSMYFSDWDGDGAVDLFWGDFFEPGILLIENRGACGRPLYRHDPIPLQADGRTILTSGFNAPAVADLDGDGRKDLFLGVLGGAYNPIVTAADNFHYYRRLEGGGLTLVTRRFLDGIDVGTESVPAFVDFDGDGDLDLVIGNKIDPAAPDRGRLYFFENIGSPTAPRFQLADTLDIAATYHLAPVFADLTGNGLPDLVLGTWNQGVLVYRNEGTPERPRYVQDESLTVRLTRGSNAAPALVDIDGDGDLDLFVGQASGRISFYRNEGSPTEPRFVLVTDDFEQIDVGRRSHPVFVDLNGDGVHDLVVGREEGGAVLYRNVGTATDPRFVEDPDFLLPLPPMGAPRFVDLFGTGRLDVVAGSLSGGVVFFHDRRAR